MYRNPYGQFQPGGIWEGLKRSFRRGTALTRLIYVNVGFFLFLKLVEVGFVLAGYQRVEALLLAYTGVPALPEELLYTPWTVVTYMFTHFGFLHLLFNMLWLYWFGSMFLNYFSGRKLVWVYVLGGLFGALLYMAAYSVFPAFAEERYLSRAIGASASVMAVVFAVCAYLPNHRVYVFLVGPAARAPGDHALAHVNFAVLHLVRQAECGRLRILGQAVEGLAPEAENEGEVQASVRDDRQGIQRA